MLIKFVKLNRKKKENEQKRKENGQKKRKEMDRNE